VSVCPATQASEELNRQNLIQEAGKVVS
jgi:hypothetical protein